MDAWHPDHRHKTLQIEEGGKMKRGLMLAGIVLLFNVFAFAGEINITGVSNSIDELRSQIKDITIDAAVLNSDNNLFIISSKRTGVRVRYYVSTVSISGKVLSNWKKILDFKDWWRVKMPFAFQSDNAGNVYVFWGYGEWDGPRLGYLRFTMLDKDGNVKIDTFKVDNEEQFDSLNIGYNRLKTQVDERGNLHLFSGFQYVKVDTRKGIPEITERIRYKSIFDYIAKKKQKIYFNCYHFDFYPILDKKLLVFSYLGYFQKNFQEYKSTNNVVYKNNYFSVFILNFSKWQYENPKVINIPEYSQKKYNSKDLPKSLRFPEYGKEAYLFLTKLRDRYLFNITIRNGKGEFELFQIFFDKEGNPIKPDKAMQVTKPGKFEDLSKGSQMFAKVMKYSDGDVEKKELLLFGFDEEGKYYESTIDLEKNN